MIVAIIRSILAILESIASMVIQGSFELLSSAIVPEKDHSYSAAFGEVSKELTRKGGVRIGYKWGVGDKEGHVIAFGGSGSMKSSCICFNTLMQSHECSYVVFDIGCEMFRGVAPYMQNCGFDVFRLDYDNWEHSIGFNVLAKCTSEQDIFRSIQVLVKNSLNGTAYDYWAQSAENLIGLFAYILWKYADSKYVHLPNVLNMIQIFAHSPERIDRWVAANVLDERILNRYKSVVVVPDKTLQSTISTATTILAIYNNPNIASITSHDTLPFDTFRNKQKRSVLFICGSPAMTTFCKGISSNYFDAFFAHIMRQLPDKKVDAKITFLIDEAATMRLEVLPSILEVGRKYQITLCTLWQDFDQCQHLFGHHQAENIFANSRVKVFMGGSKPLSTCKMLQEILGRYQYETEKGTKVRELLTAQEIFQLKDVLVLNGSIPLLLKPLPYFLNKKLKEYTELPPYVDPATNAPHIPEYLDFA